MKKRIFVSGATGFQGSSIAHVLLEKGNRVVTLIPETEQYSTEKEGLDIVMGGLENKAAVHKALKNVDAAVFTFPLIFDWEKALSITDIFIEAAMDSQIPLIVFNSSFDLPIEKTGWLALDLKIAIQNKFDASDLNVITLIPDIYIDNLTAPWSIHLILDKGIMPYPIPSEKKVPWISHFDLARFIESALQKTELAGQKLPIGGHLYTGEAIATAISQDLKRDVQFISLTPDEFENQLVDNFGALNAKEISNLYRYVAANREILVSKDFKKTQEYLSVKPTSLMDWISSVNWDNQT